MNQTITTEEANPMAQRFMQSQEAQKNQNAENEPSSNGLKISDTKYEEIIKKSLVTKGNNYLIKKLLEKIQAGDEVIISAIGGSVTEGAGPAKYTEGYAYQFRDMFIEKYAADKTKVKFIPAGIGGTPSPMGLIRYQKDVLDRAGRAPDLLIIEFAVNDWLECSKTRAIERLVRDALEKDTAVIMLYAAATYQNQQGQISPVADFYQLPQVSISDGLAGSGVNQEKDSKIYYSDYVHPTKNGHTYMARCLMNLIVEIDASASDSKYQLPEAYKNENPFESFATVYSDTQDKNLSITAGGFTQKDTEIQAYLHGGKCFPENWYNDGSNSEPFKMTLECKSLIMIYKNASTDRFGKYEAYVDGKLQNTYAGHEEGGWNNCMIVMLIDEKTAGKHTIEIKAAPGEEGKAFTLLAFGYAR